MLALIGIGLTDQKDISLKGLEYIRKADQIYLENYTSKLQCTIKDLEELYQKEIILAERAFVEDGKDILKKAQTENVALLIIGDVFSATTHTSLYFEAKKQNIETFVIHNASVLTAIGITGLSLYKFGKTTSIPFHKSKTAQQVIEENGKLHTLCLLDLKPKENKFMEAKEAIEKLQLDPEQKVVVCVQLASSNPTIRYTQAKNIKNLNKFPQCLIIPGDLHFMEEEVLEQWENLK